MRPKHCLQREAAWVPSTPALRESSARWLRLARFKRPSLVIFNIQLPASVLHGALFLYSGFLAFHMFFAVNFLTGLCAVYTEKLQGFLWAKFMLLQFLSGLLLPFSFFPWPLNAIFEVLPFGGMAHTPLNIYLGRIRPEDLAHELALQTAWTVLFILACDWLWNSVRRRLSVLGG